MRTAHGSIAASPRSRPSTSLRRLGVRLAEDRLAEVRPLLPEAADESLDAGDADAHAVDRQDRVRAVEHDDARLGERARRDRPAGRTASRGSRAPRRPGPRGRGTRRRRRTPRRPGRAASGRRRAGSGRPAPRRARNASRTRSRSAEPAWMSPAAATRIVFAMRAPYPRIGTSTRGYRTLDAERRRAFSELLEAMKRGGRGAARPRASPFALAGGLAVYARGGPATEHDVDFILRADDAERALELLGAAGFRCERPPEGWLYKVFDDERRDDRPDLRAEQQARGRRRDPRPRRRARGLRDHAEGDDASPTSSRRSSSR